MDFSSYESSIELLEPEWSAVASVLPSVFDSAALSDALIRDKDLLEAIKIYSLPRVDMKCDPLFDFQPIFLGAGASYRVYMQKFKQWEKPVAVKYIKSRVSPGNVENVPSVGKQKLTVLREIHSLCLLTGHPNVTTLLAWGQEYLGELTVLITEYAPLGGLDSFLRENRHSLKADDLFKVCADVAEGIHAMHSQRMIHGDVKIANVLIFGGASGRSQFTAKISDLAFSISLDFHDADTCYRGTYLYNAPEIKIQGSRRLRDINPLACDVYSYGLLVWTTFKYGDFFLKGVSTLVVGNSSEEQMLDSFDALQLLEHAVEFARARDSRAEAEILGDVLSASLQVDPVARLSIESICRILSVSTSEIPATANTQLPKEATKRRFTHPRKLDIFSCRWLPYPREIKQQLAQKLLSAAENPKNPKGADLAFEVSKCFAIGFGFPKDIQSMDYWLSIAADRGHGMAKAISTQLKISKIQTDKELGSHNILKPDPTTLALEMNCKLQKAEFDKVNMDHIANFQIYSGGNTVAIESMIQKSISEGLDIDSITGNTDQSMQNAQVEAKISLLHWAARGGRIKLIQTLLKFGANINSTDPILYRTPLLFALHAGQIDAAELLLREGADANIPDFSGRTASRFLYNVPPDKFSMMVRLLEKIPKAALPRTAQSHQPRYRRDTLGADCSPLHAAATDGHIQAVLVLLKEIGHDMTAEDFFTTIRYAAMGLHTTVCDIVLHRAFQSFRFLPENPFSSIIFGSPYLWMLFHGKRWAEPLNSTIRVLLSHGIDINGCDASGNTAMGYAVMLHEPEIASTLQAYGASLENKSRNRFSMLHNAIFGMSNSGNVGCVRWLLDYGDQSMAFMREGASRPEWSYEPLHIASMYNAYGAAKAILEHSEVGVNARTSEGDTPLHVACSRNALETVQLLLDHGADATAVNNHKYTPLEKAVHGISIEVVEYFLSNNLPTHNTRSTPPRSILAFYAGLCEPGRTRLSQILTRYTQLRSPEALYRNGATGRPILSTAILAKNDDLTLDLIHAGAEIGSPHDPESEWILLISDYHRIDYYSAGDPRQTRQYFRTVQAFVDLFKQRDLLEARGDGGETLLFKAARCGNVAAVTVLLDAGLSARDTDSQGCTALHEALLGALYLSPPTISRPADWLGEQEPAKNRALVAILHLLLNAGADPNAEDSNGVRPLSLAVSAAWRLQNIALVELLCQRGVHSDAPAQNGIQPLHVALEAPTFIKSFPDGDVNAQDARCVETMRGLVRVLGNAGTLFETLQNQGISATMAAVCKCNPIGLRAMLAEGVGACKALGTGHIACLYAAQWVETQGPGLIQSSRAWLEARFAARMENMDTLREYFDGRLELSGSARAERVQEFKRLLAEDEDAEFC